MLNMQSEESVNLNVNTSLGVNPLASPPSGIKGSPPADDRHTRKYLDMLNMRSSYSARLMNPVNLNMNMFLGVNPLASGEKRHK